MIRSLLVAFTIEITGFPSIKVPVTSWFSVLFILAEGATGTTGVPVISVSTTRSERVRLSVTSIKITISSFPILEELAAEI